MFLPNELKAGLHNYDGYDRWIKRLVNDRTKVYLSCRCRDDHYDRSRVLSIRLLTFFSSDGSDHMETSLYYVPNGRELEKWLSAKKSGFGHSSLLDRKLKVMISKLFYLRQGFRQEYRTISFVRLLLLG